MKPIEANAVAIDTTIRFGDRKVFCRGTHVYRPGKEEEGVGDTLDPGLVMTGTKCGDNAVSPEYMKSSLIGESMTVPIVFYLLFSPFYSL